MLDFKISLYLKFIFIISLLTTISAYYIEYILGHQPCSLCIIERIPYILSLFILLIKQEFFEESLICNVKDGANILSKEQLLVELQKKVVSCKDVTFRIFGLSLTTINIFISLFLVVLLIKIFNSYENKK